MKVGDNGTQNPATIDFKAEGMAKLRYDLGSSKATLVQAKLSATDINFSLLGPEPRILDLAGDQISDPAGSIRHISVEIDQLSTTTGESAEIETLNINTSHLANTPPAGATTGL